MASRPPIRSRASRAPGRARTSRPLPGFDYAPPVADRRPSRRGAPPARAAAGVRGRAHRGRGCGAVALLLLLGVAAALGFGIVRSGALAQALEVSNTSSPVRQAIVEAAQSQVGYTTDPEDTNCNKFSAHWGAGSAIDEDGERCAAGTTSEEWCSDFAAWAWQKAGVSFTYGYGPEQLNGGSISFYEWAVAAGTWHPASSGYLPQPGDAAVYGINSSATWSAHVAIVTGYQIFTKAPYAINGNGDRGGFSLVEAIPDETRAAISGDETLSGYASPLRA
ncbi:MAG: CHAP domain-containing protein [Candidatus Dormibacteraceae bacterium]